MSRGLARSRPPTAVVLAVFAVVGVVVAAALVGLREAKGPAREDQLARALGTPAPGAPLVRKPNHAVAVRLGHRGYTVSVPRVGAVTLAAAGTRDPWSRF